MEAVVVLVILAVLGVILGVSLTSVAAVLMVLMIAALVLMLIFFLYMSVILLRSERAEGELDGFEKPEHGYETAFYLCEGSERLPNIFPAENVMREFIYRKGRTKLRLFRGKRRSYVIDRHSMAIIIFGLILTLPSLAYVIIEFSQIRKG